MGVVIGCTAPFIHYWIPKESAEIRILKKEFEKKELSSTHYEQQLSFLKEKQKFLGFPNIRSFWYASGLPITLFIFALILTSIKSVIRDTGYQKIVNFAASALLFVSLYHLIWILWPGKDLPNSVYYTAIVFMAILGSILSRYIVLQRFGVWTKIGVLMEFISVKVYSDYIDKADRRSFTEDSFEVYDKITKK